MPSSRRTKNTVGGGLDVLASISASEPIRNLALSNAVRPGVWGYLKTLADEVAALTAALKESPLARASRASITRRSPGSHRAAILASDPRPCLKAGYATNRRGLAQRYPAGAS